MRQVHSPEQGVHELMVGLIFLLRLYYCSHSIERTLSLDGDGRWEVVWEATQTLLARLIACFSSRVIGIAFFFEALDEAEASASPSC